MNNKTFQLSFFFLIPEIFPAIVIKTELMENKYWGAERRKSKTEKKK